ncbi:MAG: DUF3078 domain-containing protein [Bacteroidota bacterium]
MKQLITTIALLCFLCTLSFAQTADTSYWKKGGVATFGFTNTGLSSYWQAGGFPSQSFIFRVNMHANYAKGKHSWDNDLATGYGVLRQGKGLFSGEGDIPFVKNEDRFELNSKYGRKITDKLSLSSLLNFRTQFAPGFSFDPGAPTAIPDPDNIISQAFAPAYLNYGLGLDYKPTENFSLYYSPLTAKVTIVTVEEFRATYMPPDMVDQLARFELGSNLNIKWLQKIDDNITFQTNANFFTNYLAGTDEAGKSQFGNIDVNWETLTTAKVNDWLAITFSTNLIYDDDIKFEIIDQAGNSIGFGPRTQLQTVFAVGITYNFLK